MKVENFNHSCDHDESDSIILKLTQTVVYCKFYSIYIQNMSNWS